MPDDRHDHGQQAVADRAEVGLREDEHATGDDERGTGRRSARRPSRRSPRRPATRATAAASRSRSSSEACRQISAPPRQASSAGTNSPALRQRRRRHPDRRQRRRDGHGVLQPGRQPPAPGLGVGRHHDPVRAVERHAETAGRGEHDEHDPHRAHRNADVVGDAGRPRRRAPRGPGAGTGAADARRARSRSGSPHHDCRPGPRPASGGAPRPGIRVRIGAVPDVPEPRRGARFSP